MRLPFLLGLAVARAHGVALRAAPHALTRVHRAAATMLAPGGTSPGAAEALKERAGCAVSPALVRGLAAAGGACLLAAPAVAHAVAMPGVAENPFVQALRLAHRPPPAPAEPRPPAGPHGARRRRR